MAVRTNFERRSLLAGMASWFLTRFVSPAYAATISPKMTDLGSKYRLQVKISGSAAGINFGSHTFGPVDVPKNGSGVTRSFDFAGVQVILETVVKNGILHLSAFVSLGNVGNKVKKLIGKIRKSVDDLLSL